MNAAPRDLNSGFTLMKTVNIRWGDCMGGTYFRVAIFRSDARTAVSVANLSTLRHKVNRLVNKSVSLAEVIIALNTP